MLSIAICNHAAPIYYATNGAKAVIDVSGNLVVTDFNGVVTTFTPGTDVPTSKPTAKPTTSPTSFKPTVLPSGKPTTSPTSFKPTVIPSRKPTLAPSSLKPTVIPSGKPTVSPTAVKPSTLSPSLNPITSKSPTASPVSATVQYDVIVIGSGASGLAAARVSSVVLIQRFYPTQTNY